MEKKDISVLILSSDAYEDIWYPFFTLLNRYWSNKYKKFIATETKSCEYATALKYNYPLENWTTRIRKSLEEIPTKYVIMMDGDFFLRSHVDQARIEYCLDHFDEQTAVFNFEKKYTDDSIPCEFDKFMLRLDNSPFRYSCQPCLWDKYKLIEFLQCTKNPWEWESTNSPNKYKYFINSGDLVFNYGYKSPSDIIGLRQGKWIEHDVVKLFEKEDIKVDYSKRGFYSSTDINKSFIQGLKPLDVITTKPKIKKMKSINLVGTIFNDHNKIPSVPVLTKKLRQKISHALPGLKSYGVNFYSEDLLKSNFTNYFDRSPFLKSMFLAGIPVSRIAETNFGNVAKILPESEYAVFTYKGSLAGKEQALLNTISHAVHIWLRRWSYFVAFGYYFILFDERFKGMDSQDSEIDIYLPIRKVESIS